MVEPESVTAEAGFVVGPEETLPPDA